MLKGSQARKKAMIKAMQAFAMIVAAHLLSASGVGAQAASKTSTAKSSNASSTTPAESGPCQIGVIPIAGDLFMINKYGPLKFLDKYSRTAVTAWALDDLVVSRVRAAAPGSSVRRVTYTREELKSQGRS